MVNSSGGWKGRNWALKNVNMENHDKLVGKIDMNLILSRELILSHHWKREIIFKVAF